MKSGVVYTCTLENRFLSSILNWLLFFSIEVCCYLRGREPVLQPVALFSGVAAAAAGQGPAQAPSLLSLAVSWPTARKPRTTIISPFLQRNERSEKPLQHLSLARLLQGLSFKQVLQLTCWERVSIWITANASCSFSMGLGFLLLLLLLLAGSIQKAEPLPKPALYQDTWTYNSSIHYEAWDPPDAWDKKSFPNPQKERIKCGRDGRTSLLCDPNNVVTIAEGKDINWQPIAPQGSHFL